MIVALDLIVKLADPATTLITGHGTNVRKPELLPHRAMILDIQAKVKALVDRGKSLQEVLAANLTAPYDATTNGDTPTTASTQVTVPQVAGTYLFKLTANDSSLSTSATMTLTVNPVVVTVPIVKLLLLT